MKRKRFEDLTNRQKRVRIYEQRSVLNRIQSTSSALQLHESICAAPNTIESSDSDHEQVCNERDRLSPIHINDGCIYNNDLATGTDNNEEIDRQSDESISSNNDSDVSTDSTNTFAVKLAETLKNINVSLSQGNAILGLLRSHPCFAVLPKDIRTLLGTCNFLTHVKRVSPGEYCHLGVSNAVASELSCARYIPQELEIDISTDGAAADSRGLIQYWPIQIRIVNLANSKPLIVGVYRGKGKPSNVDEFFEDFVHEMKQLLTDGILFHGHRISIKLRAFIADAPARAFVLRHRGHMSLHPCSKCKVVGTRYEENFRRRVRTGTAFYGIDHEPRTDEEALNRFDTDHYLADESPLTQLNMGLVSAVPYEYMHPTLIGVMKKICEALFEGKYLQRAKLSAHRINTISVRLQTMDSSCPHEFQRRPRAVSQFSNYKATEFRHLLLYAGPIVLKDVIAEDYYVHFLLFHTSMRILCSPNPSEYLFNIADQSLKLFVTAAQELYGSSFLSYNIHCLLHLTEDVRRFGPLDSYSAFPYESNMPMFKKFVRNHHRPLQQFALRLMERKYRYPSNNRAPANHIVVSKKRIRGPLPLGSTTEYTQYKQLVVDGTRYSIGMKDNCCKLHDSSLCKIVNILQENNEYYFVVKQYLNPQNFYNVGLPSTEVGIFKCDGLASDLEIISVRNVASKCYMTKLWSDDPDDLLHSIPGNSVIMTLIHQS